MKTIIAGSRDITDPLIVGIATTQSGFNITEVVSGTARGVDSLGETWALSRGLPIKRFPADWGRHGKAAGYVRNREMSQYADALIAIWDTKSKGTGHMIDLARAAGLKVYVHRVYA